MRESRWQVQRRPCAVWLVFGERGGVVFIVLKLGQRLGNLTGCVVKGLVIYLVTWLGSAG